MYELLKQILASNLNTVVMNLNYIGVFVGVDAHFHPKHLLGSSHASDWGSY